MGVKMEVLETTGENPLPPNNHRFGNRKQQIGIRVEEKWERSDYVPIPEFVNQGGDIYGEGHPAH
jgi:formate dehydrogenase major subunit